VNPAAPAEHTRLALLDEGYVDGADDPIHRDISAAACIGRSLFLASDEDATVERLVQRDDGWADHVSFALGDLLDLPDGREGEMDIEGMSIADGFLWVVGSHSLKRKKVTPKSETVQESLDSLATVSRDRNRFTLACLPLVAEGDGVVGLAAQADGEDGPREARMLKIREDGSNKLVRDAALDPLFGRFMQVPSKENGFDIEGLEVVDGRVFLGLRGPVVRGMALVLEVQPEHRSSGRLRLRKLEDSRYRRHFLDLDGLGVRDLVRDGENLLVLAGPTLDVDGPVRLYRWSGFVGADGPSVVGDVERVCDLPAVDGYDHAEAMTWVPTSDGQRLLIGHDDPAPWRVGDGQVTDELVADLYDLSDLGAHDGRPAFDIRHLGGGWHQLSVHDVVVDRVRGAEAAQARVDELNSLQQGR
jgi:hypothetical protein